MTAPKIFTIAASAPFAETLAQGLIARIGAEPLTLADTRIYLPTRRAARSFGNVFARIMDGAALLPQFHALGDTDDDPVLDILDIPPAIKPIRRQLLLATLIKRWDTVHRAGDMSFAQAANLAESLATVMDEIETQNIDLEKLDELVPIALAQHWEDVTQFLALIREAWPGVLAAEGCMNPAARRSAALLALARRLEENPPCAPVIAAGSTGSIPATAHLLGVIARLPQGSVILPGLDCELDEKSWSDLDPGHPQFGMKQLLDRWGARRADVREWHPVPTRPAREYVLREALRPAPTTDAWRAIEQKGAGEIARGLNGISVLDASDPAQEALLIAMILRETLETPERTGALVTPDRNLARRVAAELRRWNIEINDSSGRPLSHMAAGSFLCLLAEAAVARFAPVPLLALFKHPFAAVAFRNPARLLDRLVLRGPSPDPGLDGIANAIARAAEAPRAKSADDFATLAAWWKKIIALLHPLEACFDRREIALDEIINVHFAVAEALSTGPHESEDSKAAEELIFELMEASVNLPPIEPGSYPALFRSIAFGRAIRPLRTGQHRIAILGPLEARLQAFDVTILGGLNEGTWPVAANADPWFSRPMRRTLGLEQPERGTGQAAHDFSVLTSGANVFLIRARKSQGAPTVPSRWLQRLMQLTRGLGLEDALRPDRDYAALAIGLTQSPVPARIAAPAPTPPIADRPRALSVTEIETWLRDPYAIYAKHVLRLRPLRELEENLGPMERGSGIHRALELFMRKYPDVLPGDAVEQLIAIADDVFAALGASKAAIALWRPRFISGAHWFISTERTRRARIIRSHLEVDGSHIFPGPAGPFRLRCRADRIDELAASGGAIIDYKTGVPPSLKQVHELLAPQLPLEGAILEAGGFENIAAMNPRALVYIRFSGGAKPGEERDIPDAMMLSEKATAQLTARIAQFDDETTPYLSRVRPWRTDQAGDYDHLARVREWSLTGWADGEE